MSGTTCTQELLFRSYYLEDASRLAYEGVPDTEVSPTERVMVATVLHMQVEDGTSSSATKKEGVLKKFRL